MVTIRPALIAETETLTALCHRSKAHWGYDRDFMERSREALTVKEERVRAGNVLVAELDGTIAGVAAIAPDDDGFEIELFFVDPPAMGHGVGAKLFKALVEHAKEQGIPSLSILSDPQAAPFYEKMGAIQVGTARRTPFPAGPCRC